MIVLEIFQLTVLLALFIDASISDLKSGTIRNKSLLIALICGSVSVIPYYLFFATDCLVSYGINIAISLVVGVLLYSFGIWGAGDSKLLSVTTILFPARIYCLGNKSLASCFLLISLVFIAAFVYVLGETVYLGIKHRDLFSRKRVSINWKLYLKNLAFFFIYLSLYASAVRLLPQTLLSDTVMLMAMQFVVILIGIRIEDKVGWPVIIGMTVCWLILLVLGYSRFDFSGINWKAYLIAILLMVFTSVADKYNYKSIPVDTLRPGMILSMGTALAFANSKVKGLPLFSTEDLKSRLSSSEVESIRSWSNTREGKKEIIIVRKMPFALFIAVGTFLFTLMEVTGI